MAYSGDLLRINNTKIEGLKEYKLGYNKLWKDADRNMNGDVRASLIGIFPKIELSFRPGLNEQQVKQIIGLLDLPYFSVTYFDPKTTSQITAQYYSSDYTVELLDRSRGL
ncbi:MAG: hypothetical protein Q4C83_03000, partial [Candidatus Saccharibacteria bacterium]|nr:hypothetical protein [Candidatus Saccharibacteria bacterium]